MDFRGYINKNHFMSLSYYSKLNMFQQVSHLLVMLCCLRKTEVRENKGRTGCQLVRPLSRVCKLLAPRDAERRACEPHGEKVAWKFSDSTLQAARRGGRLPTYISHFLSTLSITTNEELNGHRLKYQFWLTFVVQIFYMLFYFTKSCEKQVSSRIFVRRRVSFHMMFIKDKSGKK
jgi:hypothetical protein